jgi:hypothetical protein
VGTRITAALALAYTNRIGHSVRVVSTPARFAPPQDADAWLDVYFDGDVMRIEEEIKPDANLQQIRLAEMRSLRDALAGRYWPGIHRPFDLTAQWWVLRLRVDEGSDYAGLGGGPLNAPPEYLRSVRSLVEAALAHVSA